MKRLFLACFLLCSCVVYSQTTYYWVGENNDSINVTSNWNTVQNGTGTFRSSNSNATDILIFDGINIGGTPFTVGSTGGISCAQLKYINGANVNITRTASGGTTTITIAGDGGDDFFVDATSRAGFTSTSGSVRIDMAVNCTGRVNGEMATVTSQQFRITNTTAGPAGTMIFSSGSRFYTNITGASSYAFGSSAQASQNWVTFEAGSHLYFDGGNSPHGSGNLFSAIDMRPGSTWHHRATNTGSTAGNMFNRKSYGNVIVENNATLLENGTIYQIENLTITTGSTFTTHSSGQLVLLGNLLVDGVLTAPAGSTNELVMGGSTPQVISGSGTINAGGLIITNSADVTLNKSINLANAASIYGKLNFNSNQVSGAGTFRASGITTPAVATGNLTAGAYYISGNAGILTTHRGLTITGTGIAPNTSIVTFNIAGDTVYLSQPVSASGTAVTLSVNSNGATLQTSNTNGFDPATGSVTVTGIQTYENNLNYIINGATTWPFGITTAAPATAIDAAFVEIGAAVTTNRSVNISNHLTLGGKMTLRPVDNVHLLTGAVINGTFGSSAYIATDFNTGTGEQGVVQIDGVNAATTIPVGTPNYYLPVVLTASASDFTVSVFEGITANGLPNGIPLTPLQKQTVVNAVWNINRVTGSGNADINLNWNTTLEGATFTTLPNTDIGLIHNTGSTYTVPLGPGDNTANTAAANVSSFGAFSAGAIPQADPFVFNPLPVKTYGDPDFSGGATSLNTAQPITYTSSNAAVATIVAGNIHITGAGVTDITASQATDGNYPAASMMRTLTVDKAALTITADDKTKFEGQANPSLTATYTGLVYGETQAVLLTPAVITTTAVTASPAGNYPITVNGATSNNYAISFVNAVMTVQPRLTQTITFAAPATKTYGNADFAHGASSTNTTIPVVVTSSNTNVATIVGNNIHIVGAGTSTITASQAGSVGYFPATDVVRTLTINKAALSIRVRDTLKTEGEVNPPFTITYSGFVLNETVANLLTPATATTTAITSSPAGYYPITLSGATSNNYTITYTNARLTILLPTGNSRQHLFAYQPGNNNLTVRIFSIEPGLADISLYDINGKPLMKKNVYLPVGFIDASLGISTVPSGIYVVTVKGNGVNLKKTIPIIKR